MRVVVWLFRGSGSGSGSVLAGMWFKDDKEAHSSSGVVDRTAQLEESLSSVDCLKAASGPAGIF